MQVKRALVSGLVLCALGQKPAPAVTIDHSSIAGVTNTPQAVMDKVGLLRWFFTHASVGGNIITGMNVLRASDTNRYRLAIYNYDGDNSDWAYHGGIETSGGEGGPDYSAAAPPAASNGVIYECQRGNPAWDNKIVCFSNSVALAGWRFPAVNVVMDKFCWIDPYADPAVYCAVMSALEAAYPETLFVYLTMPLTTETAGSENDDRNDFNRAVRSHCAAGNKWLLDVADVEAWSTNGVPSTYVSGIATNQRMVSAYAVNAPGGDYHLNALGRRQTALAWYALAAALFRQDRDGDGAPDGDELLAGTRPTETASHFRFTAGTGGGAGLVLAWTSSSNRQYSLQTTSNLTPVAGWTNVAAGIAATPPQNSYTVHVGAAQALIYRATVSQ
jgi:hypothetical protein